MTTAVPEYLIRDLLRDGFASLSSAPGSLDSIWKGLAAADLDKVKSRYARNPPTVITGFARPRSPFPLVAVTLQADSNSDEFLGGGEFFDDEVDNGIDDGTYGGERTRTSVSVWVYAEHGDVCQLLYRAARRILRVGRYQLQLAGLTQHVLSGQELAPETTYLPETLHLRRISFSFVWTECWSLDDQLAIDLGHLQEDRLGPDGVVGIHHEDQPNGNVHPYTE